jgi:hypothetical protein
VVDSGVGVLIISEAELRTQANRRAPVIAVIPVNLTLPVIARTPDRQWLKVNYRGVTGWIAEFLTSTTANLDSVTISVEYAADPAFEHIPPEVQIAQIDRLLTWIDMYSTTASDVAFYWQQMKDGETMECRPPASDNAYYAYTQRDLVELPELRRQVRLLKAAIDDLNSAIVAMERCGVYLDKDIRAAYADAVNARLIFDGVKLQMENLKERIQIYGS